MATSTTSMTTAQPDLPRGQDAIDRIRTVAEAVGRVEGNGWFSCRCPLTENHPRGDKKPSLRVKLNRGGGVTLSCMSGECTSADIAERFGVDPRGGAPTRAALDRAWITSKHTYRDPDGRGAICVRYDLPDGSKEIRWWKPRGQDGKADFGRPFHVLYAHDPARSADIVVAEGEKATDALRAAGVQATCGRSGSGAAPLTIWSDLAGLDVVVWTDKDDAGRRFANDVRRELVAVGATVRTLRIDEIGEIGDKGDAADLPAARRRELVAAARGQEPDEGDPFPDAGTNDPDAGRFGHGRFAAAFAERYETRLRYDPSAGAWLHWRDGRGWRRRTTAPLRAMSALVREMVMEAGGTEPEIRAALRSWDRKGSHEGALAMAGDESADNPDVRGPLAQSEWDVNPDLLAHPDGTVTDMATRERRGQRRGDYLSRHTAVAPADPDTSEGARAIGEAAAYVGAKLLHPERIAYFRTVMFRCAQGRPQDLLLACKGPTASGKGTIVGSINRGLGEYGHTLRTEHLMARKHDPHPQWHAAMEGKHLAVASETPEGREFNASLVSSLVGGDPQTAHRMRENDRTWEPRFDLVLLCNNMPSIKRVLAGLRRRVRIIGFPVSAGAAKDGAVRARWLSADGMAAMLGWVLTDPVGPGTVEPTMHPEDADATEAYFGEPEDTIERWYRSGAVLPSEWGHLATADAYEAYLRAGWPALHPAEGTGKRIFSARFGMLIGADPGRRRVNGVLQRGWDGYTLATAPTLDWSRGGAADPYALTD